MKSYVDRLIYICHKRKTFAMGGMSAAIPIKDDAKANNEVMERIRQDKIREALAGHDGTWVAHPALVDVAKEVFDKHMPTPNQIESKPGLAGRYVSEKNLLQLPNVPFGEAITSDGLSKGISIVLCYTEAWLRGVGCIPLNNHMEDAATAEISRAQIWQWRHQKVSTQDDGKTISPERISLLVENEVEKHDITQGKWLLAGKLVRDMLNRDILDDFLTTVAYPHIMTLENVDTLSRL
jgi:malate synthase